MTHYFDLSDLSGCVGIIVSPGDTVVCTGTTVHTESAKYRGCEAAERLARDNDLHLWYDDERPDVSIYTVPKTEIGGYDNRGGLFVGCMDFTLWQEKPMYYIDREGKCFLITQDSRKFQGMGLSWREKMVPTDTIGVFASLAEAGKSYQIHKPKDDDELLELLKNLEERV